MTEIIVSFSALALSIVSLLFSLHLAIESRSVSRKFEVNDWGHKELDDSMDSCMGTVSKLSAEVSELKDKMYAVDEVMEDFAEAGRISRENEQAISEGINNILNYSPAIYKKDDDKK